MVTAWTCLLACLGLVTYAAAQPEADLFVALNGNDQWSGTLPAPNEAGDDGPLATIGRAKQAVIDLKVEQPERDQPITVLIRGGTHFLAEPLVFSPEDSGTEQCPVIYAAYPGESPVVSGGVAITGWERNAEGHWQVMLPEVALDEWAFSQLFVNDQRRFRPRLPDEGYYYITGEVPPSEAAGGKGYDRFKFREGDIRGDWTNLQDVEVLPFHQWAMARLRIAEVDDERHVVTFGGPTCNMAYWASLPRGHRYLVENVREALDRPGEWYLDRTAGVLTYIPLPDESIETASVIAPRLNRLIELRGETEAGLWVEQITFRGLTFAHTNWVVPEAGYSFPQAEASMSGAITATGARNCALEKCTVAHVVEWGRGCKYDRVEDCEFIDMGAGGVKLGEQGYAQDEAAVSEHHRVANNLIAHGGRMHPAAVGVWIGHSPHNEVLQNDIHDFYYTGISVGWQWGYAPSHAHHNIIADNHVYDIGHGVLSDMGGIYTLGPSEGTEIRHNCFHDIESYSYGGWGIYFDQATTAIVARDNLVYRAKTGGFHQHFGKENTVTNNIFALARTGQIIRTRAEEHLSFTFERNIVYWTEGPLLGSNWSGDQYRLDYNLYWNPDPDSIRFKDMTFAEWQATGQDQHSLIDDPLFVDPANDDYHLKPGSPAAKIGFEPFDVTGFGRQGQRAAGPDWPPVPQAYPPPPPEPPAIPLEEDFEVTEVGGKIAGFQTHEENDQATARVTDETAASGERSLKFVDLPGQEHNFNPHIYCTTNFASGVMVGSFDLRMEAGARFFHEWRTADRPYKVGPSLRIGTDSVLKANGTDLVPIPQGTWVHFEITCGLGDDADGTYDLAVRLPGDEQPQRWTELECDPEFTALRWFGFVAEGVEEGVFYLDNVRLGQQTAG
jgi:hypothetical protein